MKSVMAFGAAAIAAAVVGCSGGGGNDVKERDWHVGPPEVCECKITGGGVFILDGERWTFGLNAIPTGNGGVEGHITLQEHGVEKIFCKATEIVRCERDENHNLIGEFTGIERDTGLPCDVIVVDAGEPGRDDTITYSDSVSFGPIPLEKGGNLQVHLKDLDRCRPPPPKCEPGFCVCPDNNQCEPCPEDPVGVPTIQPL